MLGSRVKSKRGNEITGKIMKKWIRSFDSSYKFLGNNVLEFQNEEVLKNIREHKLEDAVIGDEIYCKGKNKKKWRGPGEIIGLIYRQ